MRTCFEHIWLEINKYVYFQKINVTMVNKQNSSYFLKSLKNISILSDVFLKKI